MPITSEEFLAAKRILIIRPQGIGDLIMTIPAIRLLRKMIPSARIDAVLRRSSEPLARDLQLFDNIYTLRITYESDTNRKAASKSFNELIKNLRANQYDIAIDFDARSLPKKIAFHANPKRIAAPKWSFLQKLDRCPLTFVATDTVDIPLSKPHMVDRTTYLVQALSATKQKCDYNLNVPSAIASAAREKMVKIGIKNRFAIIHPISDQYTRNWDLDRFSEVTNYLIEKYDLDILYTGSKSQAEILETLKSSTKHSERCYISASDFSLTEMHEVCRLSQLIVSVDTSMVHIADMANAPIVGIYTPYNTVNHPYSQPDSILIPDCPGEIFRQHDVPADDDIVHRISRVTVQMVTDKIDEILMKKIQPS
jgi:heptosyltransferase-3